MSKFNSLIYTGLVEVERNQLKIINSNTELKVLLEVEDTRNKLLNLILSYTDTSKIFKSTIVLDVICYDVLLFKVFKNSYVVILFNLSLDSSQQEDTTIITNLLQNTPLLVYWKDLELKYKGCNKNFLYLLGCSDINKILGKTNEDLCNRRNNANLLDKINTVERQCIEEDNIIKIDNLTLISYLGRNAFCRGFVIPWRIEKQTIGVITVLQEMEDRRSSNNISDENQKKIEYLYNYVFLDEKSLRSVTEDNQEKILDLRDRLKNIDSDSVKKDDFEILSLIKMIGIKNFIIFITLLSFTTSLFDDTLAPKVVDFIQQNLITNTQKDV